MAWRATPLLCWLAAAPAAETPPPEVVFEQAAPSVVTVYTANRAGELLSQGSGVVIRNGYVLTNCHVLKGADFVGLKTTRTTISATVVEVKLAHDLCLMQAPLLKAPAIRLGRSLDLRIGQHVFAIGAPYGLELTFTEGLVSGLRRDGPYPLIQTSAAISPGSSGGALLNRDGQLVGITTFQAADGQNLNFALPIDHLAEFRTLSP